MKTVTQLKAHISNLAHKTGAKLAEKIETIISRNIANSRMRDFYDVYILKKLQANNINFELLRLWDAYCKDYEYAKNISWQEACKAISEFLKNVM
jgi:predicted nucleotidyltransferase component of viral defense system